MDVLGRYEPLVDDFDAFLAACERPLSPTVRVNSIKTSTDHVRRAFDEGGIPYERVEWHKGLFQLGRRSQRESEAGAPSPAEPTPSPGNTWPYVHGWVHGQEEVSALPPVILDPGEGDRVFDACAAPGSKTTQLAAQMNDTGTIVANDSNLGRLSALRSNADRCGVTNVAVTNRDARSFGLREFPFDAFDRALVDVPCSCEGTVRKNPDTLREWSLDHVHGIAGVQKGILRHAVDLTRPGGTVVYATCTFAPEENEAVLDHVLEKGCRLVEFDIPLATRPGLTEWDGHHFDDSIHMAKRLYPHLNDTGGFFCAKLEVTG